MGYRGAASDGNMMVIGLREIETKSAKDTLSTYKEILRDNRRMQQEHTQRSFHEDPGTHCCNYVRSGGN